MQYRSGGKLLPINRKRSPTSPFSGAVAPPASAIFDIDVTVMTEVKRKGLSMSKLVESALRLLLRSHRKQDKVLPLPTFHSGGALLDVADRDALYHAMEGR
jgi:hypothetical protein